MHSNILKVQENWSCAKKAKSFTPGYFFAKDKKFASLTNKVTDIRGYLPTFYHTETLRQVVDWSWFDNYW